MPVAFLLCFFEFGGNATPRVVITFVRAGIRAGERTLSRPRVLLADDHRGVAEALKSLLMQEFEFVGIAVDGHALIEAAITLKPDVIVADISMPGMDGIEALTHLKKKDPTVKVVFLTMYQEPALARLALDAGAYGFVLKHFAPDDLAPAIRAALEGKTYLSPAMASKTSSDSPPSRRHRPLSE